VYGGWQEEVEYSRGNGNSFAFTANRYEEYTAHQLVGSGSFDLVKDTVYFVGERDPLVYNVVDKIVLRPDGGIPQYHNLLIGDSTLIFDYGSALYDGRERVYTRRVDFFTSPQ